MVTASSGLPTSIILRMKYDKAKRIAKAGQEQEEGKGAAGQGPAERSTCHKLLTAPQSPETADEYQAGKDENAYHPVVATEF